MNKEKVMEEYIRNHVFSKLANSDIGKNVYGEEGHYLISTTLIHSLSPTEVIECEQKAEEIFERAEKLYHSLAFENVSKESAVQSLYHLVIRSIEEKE
jgi:hypothetical protein